MQLQDVPSAGGVRATIGSQVSGFDEVVEEIFAAFGCTRDSCTIAGTSDINRHKAEVLAHEMRVRTCLEALLRSQATWHAEQQEARERQRRDALSDQANRRAALVACVRPAQQRLESRENSDPSAVATAEAHKKLAQQEQAFAERKASLAARVRTVEDREKVVVDMARKNRDMERRLSEQEQSIAAQQQKIEAAILAAEEKQSDLDVHRHRLDQEFMKLGAQKAEFEQRVRQAESDKSDRAALDARERELLSSEHALAAKRAEASSAERGLVERERAVADLRKELASREIRVAEREKAMAEQRKELSASETRLAHRSKETQEAEAELASERKRLDEHSAQLTERTRIFNERVQQMTQEAEKYEDMGERSRCLAEQEQELNKRQARLQAWEGQLTNQRRDHQQADQTIAAQKADEARRVADVEARESRVAELERCLCERKQAQDDVELRLAKHGRDLAQAQKEVDAREAEHRRAVAAQEKRAYFEKLVEDVAAEEVLEPSHGSGTTNESARMARKSAPPANRWHEDDASLAPAARRVRLTARKNIAQSGLDEFTTPAEFAAPMFKTNGPSTKRVHCATLTEDDEADCSGLGNSPKTRAVFVDPETRKENQGGFSRFVAPLASVFGMPFAKEASQLPK
jgi:hypothetical protein